MHQLRIFHFAVVILVAQVAAGSGLPLEGGEAEDFLMRARVVDREKIPVGVTEPRKLTLESGGITAHAVWKTIDLFATKQRFSDGRWEANFVDSYENEIAGYELSKLLDLRLVPPTVVRILGREEGTLQLWVEGAMTETERMRQGLEPADVESWNRQMLKVRLFQNLTHNTDFNNSGNVLSDSAGRIYLIDNSRAFRITGRLVHEEGLSRFSRSLLEALRGLDEPTLEGRLGRWLTRRQIRGLLTRRDLIVRRADRMVAERGEEQVLYP